MRMKHRLITTVLTTLSVASVQAQTFERTAFEGPSSAYSTQYHWADFNADGAVDILEVDPYGVAAMHISEGGAFSSASLPSDVRFDTGRCKFSDYDGDGDLDILAADLNSIVIVNYDETNGFTVVPTGITFTYVDYGNIYWLDVDGDLTLDIIHDRKIFLNRQGVYSESRYMFPELLSRLILEDVNADGLPDAITGGYEAYGNGTDVTIFLNQGEGQFEQTGITLPERLLLSTSITAIDYDSDSDVDVFAVDYYGRGWIFRNSLAETGEIGFTGKQIFSNQYFSPAIAGDVNSDGKPDLVSGGSTTLSVLINTSSGGIASFTRESYDLQLNNSDGFDLVDFDGDQDIDVHVKGYYNGEMINLIFERSGTPPGTAPATPSNTASVLKSNIALTWDATPGLLYNIEVKRNGNVYSSSNTSASGELLMMPGSFLHRNATVALRSLPAGEYAWRVQALDPSGRASAFSTPKTFTVDDGPSSLTSNAIDLTHVELCWTYNGAQSPFFRIMRRTSSGVRIAIADVAAGVNCYTDNAVPDNEIVEYIVVAVNGEVYSAPSNAVVHHSMVFVENSFGTIDPNIITARCLPADYDLDGDYDLQFVGRIGNTNNFILKNNGDGSFSPGAGLPDGVSVNLPYYEMVGPRDLDNDGDADLVFITGSDYSWQKVTVLLNENGTFVKGFETPEYLQVNIIAVEDLNNDGRYDLLFSHVIGNSSGNPGKTELLYQTADGGFTDSNIDPMENGFSRLSILKCADLNNDGFKDLMYTSADERYIEILVNEQGVTFTKRTTILPYTFSMGIADYNGDGNVDVMMRGNEGMNLYFGDGDFTFKEPKVIPIDYLSGSAGFVHADIDVDGLSDLLITDGFYSRVILNKGNGSFKSSNIELRANQGSSFAITDFEGDGDIDIVMLGNDGQHQGINYFYTNQLADINVVNAPPFAPPSFSANYASGKAVFTWSASSDDRTPSDLLTYNLWVEDSEGKVWMSPEANESGTFRRQLREGNTGYSTVMQLNDLPAGQYTARVQSIDASFASSPWSEEVQLSINEGPTGLTVERILLNKVKLSWTTSPYAETSVIVQRKTPATQWEEIAELGGGTVSYTDSDLEYNTLYQYRVVEASGAETTAISNVAEWSTNMWVIEDTDIQNITGSMDVADFTGDGRMDLLFNGAMIYNGQSQNFTRATFENTADGWVKADIAPSDLNQLAEIAFTDLNGDSHLDIYQHGYTSSFGYKTETFLNNGDKTFTPATNLFTTGAYAIQSYFDFDMDNDLDIVARKAGSYPTVQELFRNNGQGSFTSEDIMTCYSCPGNAVVADFDGDGDEDAILLTSGEYLLHLNTPDGLVATGPSFPAYENGIAVTDFNDDGLPDVVLLSYSFYHGGTIYKNNGLPQAGGSLQFTALPTKLLSGEPSLLSADFDHDGRTDLAVVSPNVDVFLNKGDDQLQQYTLPGYRISSHVADIVDFDNDGDLDIYFSGYHRKDFSDLGRMGKILLNQTIVAGTGITNAPPDVPTELASTQDALGVHLSWSKPHDDHTPAEGLTYDVVLFRDGKSVTKGSHDPATGQRLRLAPGRSTGIATFNNLSIGEYSWRVQAIDGSFAGSGFSDEGTFTFLPPPPVIRDTVIYKCDREIILTAGGTNIQWYKDESLTQLVASGEFRPLETQVVYVVQTIDGYRGLSRRVQITIYERPAAPLSQQPNPLTLCDSWSSEAYLTATGSNLRWYSDESLNTLISDNAYVQVAAVDGTYFVTQTVQGCESNALAIAIKSVTIDAKLYLADGAIRAKERNGDHYYWYRNGFLYQQTTVPHIPYDGQTATYVVAISKGSCYEYSAPFISSKDNITALEPGAGDQLEVYPNPASEHVMLKLQATHAVVSIYDPFGKLVYERAGSFTGEEIIDTRYWGKGIYMIVVDDRKSIVTKRLAIL